MRIDQLSGFTAFYLVSRHFSFAKAAHELRVTPPAVSQQITALEDRMGVRLLNRTTRSVSLTEEGQVFLDRIEPAMNELQAASEGLTNSPEQATGRLRINVPAIACSLFLRHRMISFAKKYPGVELEIYLEDSFTDIVRGRFDVGIRLGEFLQKDMIARPLSKTERTAIVASPKYLQQHGTPNHPSDLTNHRCIAYRLRTTGALYRWEFIEQGLDLTIDPTGPLTVNDPELAVFGARSGLGIAYTIASYVGEDIEKGRLVSLLEPFCPEYPGFHCYYASRKHQPPKMKAFLQHFCEDHETQN